MLTVPITRSNARMPEMQQQHRYEDVRQPANRLQGMQVQTNADMFGAAAGRDLERAGYMTQRGANQFSRLYVDYQHAKATEAYNKFQESLTEDLYGENGIFNLKGEAAMDAPARAQSLLEARSREFAQQNGLAQGFFDDYVGRLRRHLMPQVGRFSTEQRNNWMMQTQEGLAATSMDMALKNYTDPESYRRFMAQGLEAMNKAGELAGLSQEMIKAKRDAYISKGYSGIATAHISKGNYVAAQGLIRSGAISGEHALRLEEHISSKQKADLQLSLTLKHEAERNAAKQWEDSLTMALEKGDMNTATRLAVNAPAGLKKEGFALVDHYAKGQRVVTDEETKWNLQQKFIDNPEEAAKEYNPLHYLTKLDKSDREHFTSMALEIRSGKKTQYAQMVTDSAILADGYRRMGIKGAGKATGDDLKRKMLFDRTLQEEMDAFAKEKKREPTATEKMHIMDNLLIVAKSGGWFGKDVYAFEASLKVEGVPREDALRIQKDLKKHNYAVTEDNIRKVYARQRGAQE